MMQSKFKAILTKMSQIRMMNEIDACMLYLLLHCLLKFRLR